MKQIRNAGYDCVDLNLYDFCYPDGPMMASDWKKWVNEVRQAIRDAGLVVGQIHALFGLFAAPDLTYEPPSRIFYRNIEACAMLECTELVFHQVFYREIVDTKEAQRKQ